MPVAGGLLGHWCLRIGTAISAVYRGWSQNEKISGGKENVLSGVRGQTGETG